MRVDEDADSDEVGTEQHQHKDTDIQIHQWISDHVVDPSHVACQSDDQEEFQNDEGVDCQFEHVSGAEEGLVQLIVAVLGLNQQPDMEEDDGQHQHDVADDQHNLDAEDVSNILH